MKQTLSEIEYNYELEKNFFRPPNTPEPPLIFNPLELDEISLNQVANCASTVFVAKNVFHYSIYN